MGQLILVPEMRQEGLCVDLTEGVLSNPFKIGDVSSMPFMGKEYILECGDDLYGEYDCFLEATDDPEIKEAIEEIASALEDNDVYLFCDCGESMCHGRAIKEAILKQAKGTK